MSTLRYAPSNKFLKYAGYQTKYSGDYITLGLCRECMNYVVDEILSKNKMFQYNEDWLVKAIQQTEQQFDSHISLFDLKEIKKSYKKVGDTYDD